MKPIVTVTILNPTQIRIVADGVAEAMVNVPNAERAAQIAREEFGKNGQSIEIETAKAEDAA